MVELGLLDKVAIVTGASRGLGKAIALALAQEGAKLALLDIEQDARPEKAAEPDARANVLSLRVDVSDEVQVRRAVEEIGRVYGQVDVLVNNAGIASYTALPTISQAEWDHVLAVNLRSVLLMSQAVFPIMKRQGHGAIVNISSMSGKTGGLKIGPAYSASKAGIICLTIDLARAGAAYGIRANAVAPAFIESAMMPPEKTDELVPLIPLGRMGTPEDVAAAVLYLASDRAGFVTGEILDVNGGASMD